MKKVLVGNPSYYELEGTVDRDRLLMLILDLPFGCQFSCLKCYRRETAHSESIDLELYKRVISQAREMGVKVVTFPGEGEPLTQWEALKELIEHTDQCGLVSMVYTNGALLDRAKIEWMYNHNVTLILSCDSFDPDIYRTLSGGGNIATVMLNLELAKEIYGQAVKEKDEHIITRLGMISIVQRQNKNEISTIHDWCGNDVFHIANYPIPEGAAKKNWELIVGGKLEELKAIAQEFTDTGRGGLTAPMKDGCCVALYHGITINARGDVQVCPAAVNNIVGNIKDANLDELRARCLEFLEEKGSPLCLARDIQNPNLQNHGIGLTKV